MARERCRRRNALHKGLKRRLSVSGILTLSVLAVACEPELRSSPGEAENARPLLSRVGSVATEESSSHEPWVANPQAVAPLPGCRVVVLDAHEPRLVVFDTSVAAPLARFGRHGQGPGEFGAARAVLWSDSTGSIFVAEPGNRRVMTFSPDGTLLHEVPVGSDEGGIFAWRAVPRSNGLYVQSLTADNSQIPVRFEDSLAEVDLETGALQPLFRLPDRAPPPEGPPGRVLYAPRPLWTIMGNGEIIVGQTDSSIFRLYDADGAPLREFTMAYSPRSLDDRGKQDLLRELQEQGDLSGNGPWALYSQLPIGNNVWTINDTVFALQHSRVSRPTELAPVDRDVLEWSLITTKGEIIDRLELPPDFSPRWVWDEAVHGFQRDTLGVAEVQAFRVDLPELGRD